jgi:hypothetical protein
MTTVTNECIPYQEPGMNIPASVKAGKTVIGKRFVIIAADVQGGPLEGLSTDVEGHNYVIENAGAAAKAVLGVAVFNAAEKRKVTVKSSGHILPVTAAEAIGFGELVGVGAEGKAVKAVQASEAEIKAGLPSWKVTPVGYACGNAAEGADCPVKLF